MGCRCNERGIAIAKAVSATARGQAGEVVRQTGFVVRTIAEDAAAIARVQVGQARAALVRGLRR